MLAKIIFEYVLLSIVKFSRLEQNVGRFSSPENSLVIQIQTDFGIYEQNYFNFKCKQ